MAAYQCFTDYLKIQHDDVFMRMFTEPLEGKVRKWFRDLAAGSISSWVDFKDIFLNKWAERKAHHQYLYEFYAIKRRNDENITKFNMRFKKFYNSMPMDIQPSESAAKVYYAAAHNPEFAFLLRERSSTLQQMFTDAEELENNLWSCGKQLNYRGKDGQILRKQKRKRSK